MKMALRIPLLFLALAYHVLSTLISSSTIDNSKVQVKPKTIEVPFGGTAKFTCNATIYNQYPEDYSKSLAWHCFVTGQIPSTIECSSQADRVLKDFGACSVNNVPDTLCELKVELVNQNFSCICSWRNLEDIGRVHVLLMPSDVDDNSVIPSQHTSKVFTTIITSSENTATGSDTFNEAVEEEQFISEGYVNLLITVIIVFAIVLFLLIPIIGILVYKFRHKLFNKIKLNSLAQAETQTDPAVSRDDGYIEGTNNIDDGPNSACQHPIDDSVHPMSQATENDQQLLGTAGTVDFSLHSDTFADDNKPMSSTNENEVARCEEISKNSRQNSGPTTSIKASPRLINPGGNAHDKVDAARQKQGGSNGECPIKEKEITNPSEFQDVGMATCSDAKNFKWCDFEEIRIQINRLYRYRYTKAFYTDWFYPRNSDLDDLSKKSNDPPALTPLSYLIVNEQTKDEPQSKLASEKTLGIRLKTSGIRLTDDERKENRCSQEREDSSVTESTKST